MPNEPDQTANADRFLQLIQKSRRGRLKIYIGMSAGVGKTYRMLQEAHRLLENGINIQIGFVETHNRKETHALIEGLPIIPRKELFYKGKQLEEMDVQAVINTHPEVVMVDELAHTNIPGSKNDKRWQDVVDILQAGISVISAVNIQHIESLVGRVEEITGVEITERVPDQVLRMADEIVNIDLMADELITRLEEGKIYDKAKVEIAKKNFFQAAHILQLRELALWEVAHQVERKINSEVVKPNRLKPDRFLLQHLDAFDTNRKRVLPQFEKNLKAQEGNVTEVGERETTSAIRVHFEEWKNAPASSALLQAIRNDLYQVTDLNMRAIVRKNNEAQQTAKQASTYLTIIGAVCFLLTFSFVFNFPGYIAGPIQTLTQGIKEIANRNYERRLHFRANDEFGELAQAFNVMAEKLDEYEHSSLAKIIFEKQRIETIINQMQDAVIGLNESKIILFANPVAVELIGIDDQGLIGRYAPDMATVNDLMRNLIQPMMADNQPTSNGVPLKIFANGRESYFTKDILPVTITRTAETKKMLIGHVIILKNITQFRELDAAKTNFIATISHE